MIIGRAEQTGLRERKRIATWRAIRASALEFIEVHGYEAVSVEDIAEVADVGRTTFFNHFSSKDSVVFDPDPQEPEIWRPFMRDRPEDEPPWVALRHVLVAQSEQYADRLALHKRLTAASPRLAESSRDTSDRFPAELRQWLVSRFHDGRELEATVMSNGGLAASMTAYEL